MADEKNGVLESGEPAPAKGRRKAITSLVFAALFAALTSAGTFLVIPVGPVPVVLQNLFTLLAGLVLGPALGAGAVALFIAAGAVGAPVFAGGTAGMAILLGPTGGYLLGYLLGAFIAGAVVGFPAPGAKTPAWKLVLAVALGVLAVYVPGLIRLNSFVGDWRQTFVLGFVPFIAGDAAKGIVAGLVAPRLRRTASQLLSR